jgi:hypothetical protein
MWCSELIRRDQYPCNACFNGSGFPILLRTEALTRSFGSLIAGSLSQNIGAAHTLLLGGSCCIAGAVWFASAQASEGGSPSVRNKSIRTRSHATRNARRKHVKSRN